MKSTYTDTESNNLKQRIVLVLEWLSARRKRLFVLFLLTICLEPLFLTLCAPPSVISNAENSCHHVNNVHNIHYTTAGGNENRIHLLLTQPSDCNIYHSLWNYVAPFRDAMIYGVIPFAQQRTKTTNETLEVHVGLIHCLDWLEILVKAFPIPKDLPIEIITQKMDKLDGDYKAAGAQYMTLHQTNSQNCFTFKYQWHTLFGHYMYWESLQWTPGSNQVASQMHEWAGNAVKQLSPVTHDDDDICHRERPLILFVERDCTISTRKLVDLETGLDASKVIAPLAEQLGYNTQELRICGDNKEAVQQFANANVIVSSHGAQITNLIFMNPCNNGGFKPALVEVSFRFAWCHTNDNTKANGSRPALLQKWHECPYPKKYYPKAEFFRLATGMGIRYVETIHHSLQGYERGKPEPIQVRAMVINSTQVVEELKKLKEDNDYDYKKHPTYNGVEGVSPYHIGTLSLWGRFLFHTIEWAYHFIAPYV